MIQRPVNYRVGTLGMVMAFALLVVGFAGQADAKPEEEKEKAATEQQLADHDADIQTLLSDVLDLQSPYIPFVVTIFPNEKCAGPGLGSPGGSKLNIRSNRPININSVRLSVLGIDEENDEMKITNLNVDGFSFNAISGSPNLISGAGVSSSRPFTDLLAGILISGTGGSYPLQVSANGGGDPDIEFSIGCHAGTTTDLVIGTVQVSGWKHPDAEVLVDVDGNDGT